MLRQFASFEKRYLKDRALEDNDVFAISPELALNHFSMSDIFKFPH